MNIQYKFGKLKSLVIVARLLLFGGILRAFSGIYDFFKIKQALSLIEKLDYLMRNALLFGIKGFILFLMLNWIAQNLKEKNFELRLK